MMYEKNAILSLTDMVFNDLGLMIIMCDSV